MESIIEHSGKKISSKNGFDIIECTVCEYSHSVPLPDSAELDKIYSEEYYSDVKPNYIKRMEEDIDWWNICYDDRYDLMETQLDKKGKILDIGSGTGHFLKRGIERGWDCLGFEPSKIAYNYSKNTLGLNVVNDFFNGNNINGIGKFDVIHMTEVLEHIPYPKELMRNVWKKLNDKGIICVSVPNEYNLFQIILRDHMDYPSWWEDPPHHLNYFNMETLENLIIKNGFNIIKKTVSFPIDIFLLMGKNYIGNDSIGRKCHKMRMEFEKQLYNAGENNLKKELYDSFAKLGIGRELVIFASKDEK